MYKIEQRVGLYQWATIIETSNRTIAFDRFHAKRMAGEKVRLRIHKDARTKN